MKCFFYLICTLSFISCDEYDKEILLDESKLIKRANNYYYQDEYLPAKLCFDTLISINPSNGEYFYKRAYSKIMLMDDDKGAKADFLKAIENNYKNKKGAYIGIGLIHRIAADYDSAIFFYNKALELDPADEKAKGEKKEVEEILQKRQKKDIKELKENSL